MENTNNHHLLINNFNSLLILLAFTFGLCIVAGCGKKEEEPSTKTQGGEKPTFEFSKELKDVIERKIDLIRKLAADPLIITSVRQTNDKNRTMTQESIKVLDEKWCRTTGTDEFIASFISNPCAKTLVDFQKSNKGFPEIFVTDEKGLIVAETNKTSDYNQADEDWWTSAYDNGRGKSYYGKIEYDESSQAESIPLFVPVIDPDTKKVIGIIKAVCDIDVIKMEL